MTHGHTAPSPSGVREHEGALRGRCVRSVDVHGMDRQAGRRACGRHEKRAGHDGVTFQVFGATTHEET